MSILDIHADLISSLESALDVGKIFSVFNKLINIVKDQQTTLSATETKVSDLYAKLAKMAYNPVPVSMKASVPAVTSFSPIAAATAVVDNAYIERINELEKKMKELLLNLNGDDAAMVPDLVKELNPDKTRRLSETPQPEPIFTVVLEAPPTKPNSIAPSPAFEEEPEFAVQIELLHETVDEVVKDISQLVYDVERDALADRILSGARSPTPPPKSQTPVPDQIAETEEEIQATIASAAASKAASKAASRAITPQVADVEQVADVIEKLKSTPVSPRIVSSAPVSLAPTPGLPSVTTEAPEPQQQQKSPATSIPFAELSSPLMALSNPSPVPPQPSTTIEEGGSDGPDEFSFKPVNIPTPHRSDTVTPVVKRMVNKASSPMATPKKVNKSSSPIAQLTLELDIPIILPAPIIQVPLTPLPEVPHVVIKKVDISRRRMTASRLELVTPKKRAKIIKALKKRGLFIHIARQFQEDALRKYANQSLKQRVDCLDAEIRRVYSRIEHLKNAVKKDHVALRELLPIGFHDNYCNLVEMLSVINTNSNGLQVLDNVMKNGMCYDSRTGEPPARLLEMIMNSMRSTVLHEFEMRSASEMNKFKSRLVDMSSMIVTKDDLMHMLLPSGKSSGNMSPDKGDSSGEVNTDPSHAKLVNLINRSIERHQAGLDLANSTKKYATLELSSGASEEQLEEARMAAQKYTDERIVVMKNAIKQLAYQSDSRVNQFEVDVAQMQEQIMTMQSMHQTSMLAQADNIEMFRKESEALKVLQRKVGNMGIDKLMEDLKHVHLELLQRPSASQVGEMMDLVEHTIKSHLGENIVGLKGLVEQVYKHIQHKVDREDIKNLISVKLSQMEADLLRREQESYTMTSSTRCLSCGQRPANPQQAATQGLTKGGNIAPPASTNGLQTTSHIEMTDDISASSGHRSMMSQSTPLLPSHASSEQIHTLVAGSGGLKPLLQQHSAMKPIADPYAVNHSARRRAAGAEKIPEPMYRKAKMASQIKEMVKITAPSTAMYGYGPNNPLYVMDGMVLPGAGGLGTHIEGDNSSIHSDTSGAHSGMRGNSRMKGLHINNISSTTIANTLSNGKDNSRRSSTGEYVTLPSIQSRFPPSMNDSKPTSPDGVGSPAMHGQSAKMNTYY